MRLTGLEKRQHNFTHDEIYRLTGTLQLLFILRAAWFVPPQINKWWSLGAAAETNQGKEKNTQNKFRDLYGHRNTIQRKGSIRNRHVEQSRRLSLPLPATAPYIS
jgi:hypothetical protein